MKLHPLRSLAPVIRLKNWSKKDFNNYADLGYFLKGIAEIQEVVNLHINQIIFIVLCESRLLWFVLLH